MKKRGMIIPETEVRMVVCDPNRNEMEYYLEILYNAAKRNNYSLSVLKFTNGADLLYYMGENQEDIQAVILEIDLPDSDGVEIAKKMREAGYNGEIVFLTSSKEYFLSAFDVRAYHYLLKGDTVSDYIDGVYTKLLKKIQTRQNGCLIFNSHGEYRVIRTDDIEYFEVDKRLMTVYYLNGRFEFISTMTYVQDHLKDKEFIRVHRAFLVAFKAIRKVYHDRLEMMNGSVVPIGRTYQNLVQEELKRMTQKQ